MIKNHKTKNKNFFIESIKKIENFLDLYLVTKNPIKIPQKIKEFMVNANPYFTILGVIILIPLIIIGIFITIIQIISPYIIKNQTNNLINNFYFYFSLFFLIITLFLNIMAIPGLLKRQKKGWNYLFYSSLINIFFGIIEKGISGLSISFILSIFGLYILFQIKNYYK